MDNSSASTKPQTLEQAQQRANQLQQALNSRIIIEQAKGILHERFHITIDQAFHLLRTTARHNRQPLRQLAQRIVEHPDTPSEIIQALARPAHQHQDGVDRVGRHAQQARLGRIEFQGRRRKL